MNEIQVMKECDAGKELFCEMLNVAMREWGEIVALQEIEYRLIEQFCHDTDMVSVIETVLQVDTVADCFSRISR